MFSTLLSEKGYSTSIFQISLVYLWLLVWLFLLIKKKRFIGVKNLLIISVLGILDCHSNLLIVKAYSLTTITSVMIMMVFTVPSAVLLSVLFMKVKYRNSHYLSWALSILAVTAVVLWDVIFEDSSSDKETLDIIIGDLLCLLGVFFNICFKCLWRMAFNKRIYNRRNFRMFSTNRLNFCSKWVILSWRIINNIKHCKRRRHVVYTLLRWLCCSEFNDLSFYNLLHFKSRCNHDEHRKPHIICLLNAIWHLSL